MDLCICPMYSFFIPYSFLFILRIHNINKDEILRKQEKAKKEMNKQKIKDSFNTSMSLEV